MTTIVKPEAALVVPASLQRKAGIKGGDRLRFSVTPRTITITVIDEPTYKPTKAELMAIRKGEAAISRGEYVNMADLIHDLERNRRKTRGKKSSPISR